jgi:hypothetical protein
MNGSGMNRGVVRRAGAYLRQQHLALLALFLVLTGGTAYALTGSNTVFSDDIVNDQVMSSDIQDDGIHSIDVRDDTSTGGGLAAADLRQGSVGTSEVADDSLTGADVNESSLGIVPAATLGGSGVSTIHHAGCSPTGGPNAGTYVDCGFVTRNLPTSTRVLVTAAGTSGSPATSTQGFCRLATSLYSLPDTYAYIQDESNWGLTTVVGPIGPGSVDFGVECENENDPTHEVDYGEIQISTVLLGPG